MEKKEKCGLVGANSSKGTDVVPMILQGLEALQHRGQESWGFAVGDKPVFRRMGLVSNWRLESEEISASYQGESGIGHVRYSTKGKSVIENAQPIEVENEFSIAHNGTITNADSLAPQILEEFGVSCESDTKATGYSLLHHLREMGSMFEAMGKLSVEIYGAYCFVILDATGNIFAVRDPRGYRPLSIGWHEKTGTLLAASESCALDSLGAQLIRDVEPGEMVMFNGREDGTFDSYRFAPKMDTAYCSFEYTYFAHPSSRLNGISVYEARKNVGRILARKLKMAADIVVPVPDSARPAALGFALESGIPMDEGLMKDRYRSRGSIRSFIEPEQGTREDVVRRIVPIRDAVCGKDIIVIDDSLVRGTSSRIIVDSLKKAGAKSVRMAVTFPAIRHPCFMGIDFPEREELLAHQVAKGEEDINTTAARVAKAIGVEEFYYNDTKGLSEAIGLPENSLCFACVTGDYSKLGIQPPLLTQKRVRVQDSL